MARAGPDGVDGLLVAPMPSMECLERYGYNGPQGRTGESSGSSSAVRATEVGVTLWFAPIRETYIGVVVAPSAVDGGSGGGNTGVPNRAFRVSVRNGRSVVLQGDALPQYVMFRNLRASARYAVDVTDASDDTVATAATTPLCTVETPAALEVHRLSVLGERVARVTWVRGTTAHTAATADGTVVRPHPCEFLDDRYQAVFSPHTAGAEPGFQHGAQTFETEGAAAVCLTLSPATAYSVAVRARSAHTRKYGPWCRPRVFATLSGPTIRVLPPLPVERQSASGAGASCVVVEAAMPAPTPLPPGTALETLDASTAAAAMLRTLRAVLRLRYKAADGRKVSKCEEIADTPVDGSTVVFRFDDVPPDTAFTAVLSVSSVGGEGYLQSSATTQGRSPRVMPVSPADVRHRTFSQDSGSVATDSPRKRTDFYLDRLVANTQFLSAASRAQRRSPAAEPPPQLQPSQEARDTAAKDPRAPPVLPRLSVTVANDASSKAPPARHGSFLGIDGVPVSLETEALLLGNHGVTLSDLSARCRSLSSVMDDQRSVECAATTALSSTVLSSSQYSIDSQDTPAERRLTLSRRASEMLPQAALAPRAAPLAAPAATAAEGAVPGETVFDAARQQQRTAEEGQQVGSEAGAAGDGRGLVLPGIVPGEGGGVSSVPGAASAVAGETPLATPVQVAQPTAGGEAERARDEAEGGKLKTFKKMDTSDVPSPVREVFFLRATENTLAFGWRGNAPGTFETRYRVKIFELASDKTILPFGYANECANKRFTVRETLQFPSPLPGQDVDDKKKTFEATFTAHVKDEYELPEMKPNSAYGVKMCSFDVDRARWHQWTEPVVMRTCMVAELAVTTLRHDAVYFKGSMAGSRASRRAEVRVSMVNDDNPVERPQVLTTVFQPSQRLCAEDLAGNTLYCFEARVEPTQAERAAAKKDAAARGGGSKEAGWSNKVFLALRYVPVELIPFGDECVDVVWTGPELGQVPLGVLNKYYVFVTNLSTRKTDVTELTALPPCNAHRLTGMSPNRYRVRLLQCVVYQTSDEDKWKSVSGHFWAEKHASIALVKQFEVLVAKVGEDSVLFYGIQETAGEEWLLPRPYSLEPSFLTLDTQRSLLRMLDVVETQSLDDGPPDVSKRKGGRGKSVSIAKPTSTAISRSKDVVLFEARVTNLGDKYSAVASVFPNERLGGMITGLLPDKQYSLRIRPQLSTGRRTYWGTWSVACKFRTLSKLRLDADVVGEDFVHVKWAARKPYEERYDVQEQQEHDVFLAGLRETHGRTMTDKAFQKELDDEKKEAKKRREAYETRCNARRRRRREKHGEREAFRVVEEKPAAAAAASAAASGSASGAARSEGGGAAAAAAAAAAAVAAASGGLVAVCAGTGECLPFLLLCSRRAADATSAADAPAAAAAAAAAEEDAAARQRASSVCSESGLVEETAVEGRLPLQQNEEYYETYAEVKARARDEKSRRRAKKRKRQDAAESLAPRRQALILEKQREVARLAKLNSGITVRPEDVGIALTPEDEELLMKQICDLSSDSSDEEDFHPYLRTVYGLATECFISIRVEGFTEPIVFQTPCGDFQHLISGLQPGVRHAIKVRQRSVCGGHTAWSNHVMIQTLTDIRVQVHEVGQVYATLSCSRATVEFDNDEEAAEAKVVVLQDQKSTVTAYQVRTTFRPKGDAVGDAKKKYESVRDVGVDNFTEKFLVKGLRTDSLYSVSVRVQVQAVHWGHWSELVSFRTAKPVEVEVAGLTEHNMRLKWARPPLDRIKPKQPILTINSKGDYECVYPQLTATTLVVTWHLCVEGPQWDHELSHHVHRSRTFVCGAAQQSEEIELLKADSAYRVTVRSVDSVGITSPDSRAYYIITKPELHCKLQAVGENNAVVAVCRAGRSLRTAALLGYRNTLRQDDADAAAAAAAAAKRGTKNRPAAAPAAEVAGVTAAAVVPAADAELQRLRAERAVVVLEDGRDIDFEFRLVGYSGRLAAAPECGGALDPPAQDPSVRVLSTKDATVKVVQRLGASCTYSCYAKACSRWRSGEEACPAVWGSWMLAGTFMTLPPLRVRLLRVRETEAEVELVKAGADDEAVQVAAQYQVAICSSVAGYVQLRPNARVRVCLRGLSLDTYYSVQMRCHIPGIAADDVQCYDAWTHVFSLRTLPRCPSCPVLYEWRPAPDASAAAAAAAAGDGSEPAGSCVSAAAFFWQVETDGDVVTCPSLRQKHPPHLTTRLNRDELRSRLSAVVLHRQAHEDDAEYSMREGDCSDAEADADGCGEPVSPPEQQLPSAESEAELARLMGETVADTVQRLCVALPAAAMRQHLLEAGSRHSDINLEADGEGALATRLAWILHHPEEVHYTARTWADMHVCGQDASAYSQPHPPRHLRAKCCLPSQKPLTAINPPPPPDLCPIGEDDRLVVKQAPEEDGAAELASSAVAVSAVANRSDEAHHADATHPLQKQHTTSPCPEPVHRAEETRIRQAAERTQGIVCVPAAAHEASAAGCGGRQLAPAAAVAAVAAAAAAAANAHGDVDEPLVAGTSPNAYFALRQTARHVAYCGYKGKGGWHEECEATAGNEARCQEVDSDDEEEEDEDEDTSAAEDQMAGEGDGAGGSGGGRALVLVHDSYGSLDTDNSVAEYLGAPNDCAEEAEEVGAEPPPREGEAAKGYLVQAATLEALLAGRRGGGRGSSVEWHDVGEVHEGAFARVLFPPSAAGASLSDIVFRVCACSHEADRLYQAYSGGVQRARRLWSAPSVEVAWCEPLPPGECGGVRVACVTHNAAVLSWEPPSDAASHNQLCYCVYTKGGGHGGRAWTEHGRTEELAYTMTGLAIRSNYKTCVRAYSTFGRGPMSSVVRFTTALSVGGGSSSSSSAGAAGSIGHPPTAPLTRAMQQLASWDVTAPAAAAAAPATPKCPFSETPSEPPPPQPPALGGTRGATGGALAQELCGPCVYPCRRHLDCTPPPLGTPYHSVDAAMQLAAGAVSARVLHAAQALCTLSLPATLRGTAAATAAAMPSSSALMAMLRGKEETEAARTQRLRLPPPAKEEVAVGENFMCTREGAAAEARAATRPCGLAEIEAALMTDDDDAEIEAELHPPLLVPNASALASARQSVGHQGVFERVKARHERRLLVRHLAARSATGEGLHGAVSAAHGRFSARMGGSAGIGRARRAAAAAAARKGAAPQLNPPMRYLYDVVCFDTDPYAPCYRYAPPAADAILASCLKAPPRLRLESSATGTTGAGTGADDGTAASISAESSAESVGEAPAFQLADSVEQPFAPASEQMEGSTSMLATAAAAAAAAAAITADGAPHGRRVRFNLPCDLPEFVNRARLKETHYSLSDGLGRRMGRRWSATARAPTPPSMPLLPAPPREGDAAAAARPEPPCVPLLEGDAVEDTVGQPVSVAPLPQPLPRSLSEQQRDGEWGAALVSLVGAPNSDADSRAPSLGDSSGIGALGGLGEASALMSSGDVLSKLFADAVVGPTASEKAAAEEASGVVAVQSCVRTPADRIYEGGGGGCSSGGGSGGRRTGSRRASRFDFLQHLEGPEKERVRLGLGAVHTSLDDVDYGDYEPAVAGAAVVAAASGSASASASAAAPEGVSRGQRFVAGGVAHGGGLFASYAAAPCGGDVSVAGVLSPSRRRSSRGREAAAAAAAAAAARGRRGARRRRRSRRALRRSSSAARQERHIQEDLRYLQPAGSVKLIAPVGAGARRLGSFVRVKARPGMLGERAVAAAAEAAAATEGSLDLSSDDTRSLPESWWLDRHADARRPTRARIARKRRKLAQDAETDSGDSGDSGGEQQHTLLRRPRPPQAPPQTLQTRARVSRSGATSFSTAKTRAAPAAEVPASWDEQDEPPERQLSLFHVASVRGGSAGFGAPFLRQSSAGKGVKSRGAGSRAYALAARRATNKRV